MNFRDVLRNNPFTVAIILIATLISGVTFIFSKTLAIIELCVIIALVICALKWISHISDRKKGFLRSVEKSITEADGIGKLTSLFPFPLLLTDLKGNVEWFNAPFDSVIELIGSSYSNNVRSFLNCSVFSGNDTDYTPFDFSVETKHFTVFPSSIDEKLIAFYFVEDTELKNIRTKFELTRPSVMLINVDSLEQTEDMFDHADYYNIVADVEREITKWLVDNKCIFRKFADGKFFAVTEEANLDRIIKDKFSVLDKIRLYQYSGKEADITLSVGVGRGESFFDCETSARNALDMARGRGGDQVAVKIGEDYKFFGGTTSRKEKRGKIKSRVISAALSEYIENCDNVFVMGHSFSDYDAIGAAIGVSALVRAYSKKAYIVVNKSNSLAMPLIDYIESSDSKIRFISPERAYELFSDRSMLVITDTMRSQLVDAPRLLEVSMCTILIDHHRKTVDYISSATLEFHEPYASSACEMVTELIQYSPLRVELTAFEAEALLAGIILDTKNFTVRVGVRTFEAAAFLKESKLDTVTVKKLFSGTVDENIAVSKFISGADFCDRYVISAACEGESVSRLIASKAADELLNIAGVDASFVVYSVNGTVFASARSYGVINVQLIMESFGGGGHQSMAACQCTDCDINSFIDQLKAVVDKYIKENL